MTPIEQIDQQLSTARAELNAAQSKLAASTDRERQLNHDREPLLRAAKIRGDEKAKLALARVTAERDGAAQDVADFKLSIDQIQVEISELEQSLESAQRDAKIETLRALMADRNAVGEKIQGAVDGLVKLIAEYTATADTASNLIADLELPNATSRAMTGTPLLKDFLRTRLKTLFPNELGGWTEASQRIALSEMERDAMSALERLLGSESRRAA